METSMMIDRQASTAVEPKLTDRTTPELLLIDLDLLDDNPYQMRAERDELKAAELRESIANQGQLQPILVRKAGVRWQIIFGHGRVEALRSLRNDAKTEADRARFSKVRAEERSDVSDEQMLLLALLENIQREDISPVDCSEALFRLRTIRPELDTIEAIAGKVGMEPPKVKRLLQLYAAPKVIKDAVSKGKTFVAPVGAADSDPRLENVKLPDADRMQEVRKLDLSSALSLARLYAHWCQNPTDQTASSDGTLDERMAALIDRVLAQEWGVRRVRAEVAKLAGEAGSPAIDESPGHTDERSIEKGTVPFKVNRKKVVIFTSRVAQMNDSQKAELRSVLKPIWEQLGGETQQELPSEPEPRLNYLQSLRLWKDTVKEMARGCRELWRIIQVYVIGKAPVPPDQLSRPVQLPSYGDQRSLNRGAPSQPRQLPSGAEKPNVAAQSTPPTQGHSDGKPVPVLPLGKAQAAAKPPNSNGSEHQLST